jgi:hypothetical protein
VPWCGCRVAGWLYHLAGGRTSRTLPASPRSGRAPRPAWAVALGTAVAIGGCGGQSRDPPPARPPVFALLSDRLLLKVSSTSGRPLASAQLGARSPVAAAVGDYLSLSADARRLFVLIPATRRDAQSVVELDPATLAVKQRYPLPAGSVFASLEIGLRSGRLYVAGNRGTDRNLGAPVVLVLEPSSGAVLQRLTVRLARGGQWSVFDAAVSSDEQHLAVSYHGTDTTGADWIRLGAAPRTCADRTPAHAACLALPHGAIAFRGHDLVATTGEGPLVELRLDGHRLQSWAPNLPRNHVMHVTLDSRGRRAVVPGSCGYTGGLSVIDLHSGTATVIGYPDAVCGEAAAFVDPELVAVARNAVPTPEAAPSEISFVDLAARRIVRSTATRSDIVALLTPR